MKNYQSLQPKPRRILVITMQCFGDVLLTTALLHSLRQAYPDARLDVLVFSNTASMLEGNSDVNNVIITPNRPNRFEFWRIFWRLFRQYDLSMAMQTGDRPFLYGLFAARYRIAMVQPKNTTGWWKRFFVQRWIEFDNVNTHTVLQQLKLMDLIDVPRSYSLIPPQTNDVRLLLEQFPFLTQHVDFVVLHPHPLRTYKQWTIEGWVELGLYLNKLGLKVVLSGGPAQQEIDYVASIARQLPKDSINLAGQVSLAQLTYILTQAKLYIGPDTGITHLASATGIPVIALYGPTNPVKWAPWPFGYRQDLNPFHKTGSQHVNNVSLVQGSADCVPCMLEGCNKNPQSRSQCLDLLPTLRVKEAVNQVLKQ